MTNFKFDTISSGVELRQKEVVKWLRERQFKDEYLLVSTKLDSVYSKKLAKLKTNQKLIVDLYTPIFLEKELTLSKWKPQDWLTRFKNKEMVKKFLMRGNHFLVANRRQREYWIKTSGDLGVKLEKNDISVLPTGSGLIQNSEFRIQNSARRKVVLWFGGIYPWMDPGPLVEAFSRICRKYPNWKLRILGGLQPGTGYKKRYKNLINKAKAVIPDSQLHIVDWQRNEDLNKYFKDVAFAVHLVKSTPEDFYAHRVRLLTLLNFGVPVLTSGKDVISDLIVKAGTDKRVEASYEEIEKTVLRMMKLPKDILNSSKNAREIESLYIKQEMDAVGLENFL